MRIIGRLKNGDFLVLFAEGFKVLSKKVVMAKLSGKYSVPVYIYDRNDFFNSNVKSFITKKEDCQEGKVQYLMKYLL